MEAKEWANFLLEIRKSLLKIVAIIVVAIFSFFPISGHLVSLIIEETYPYSQIEENKVRELAEQLKRAVEKLESDPTNKTIVQEEMKRLSKLLSSSLGPVVLTPLEAIVLSLKISFAIGIALAIPYLLAILARTLRSRGLLTVSVKYYAISAIFLFVLGCVYGFFIVRFIIRFLHEITVSYGVTPLYSLSDFVTFVLFMITIFGLFFEIPVVMYFLVRNKIVRYETLRYYRRHIYVFFFVISAIATPTVDVFTQIMLALPMIVLFEIGILFLRFF